MYLLKQVKLNRLTKQVPGQSLLESGAAVDVGGAIVVVVVESGRFGGGLLLIFVDRVLSQHTDPLLQLEVFGIKTEGRSQKAAIIYNIQNPGHLG